MKALRLAAAIALVALSSAGADADRPLLDLAPTPAELGQGWITNQLLVLIDPLSKPSERVDSGNPLPTEAVSHYKQAMLNSGSKAYLQLRLMHRDASGRAAYRVYLQRWPSSRALVRAVPFAPESTNLPPPEFGQASRWTDAVGFDRLTFRRDQYCAVIDFDAAASPPRAPLASAAGEPLPNWQGITDAEYLVLRRIAQVLDSKLAERSIPTNSPPLVIACAPDVCEVHKATMEHKEVRIFYGWIMPKPDEPSSGTEHRLFPHYREYVLGDYVIAAVSPMTERVYICSDCKKAYEKWKLDNKKTQ